MKHALVVVALVVGSIGTAHGKTSTETASMPFDKCLATIRAVAQELGVAPRNVVETTNIRIVKFFTVDGGVTISCTRQDNKMVVVTTKGE